VTEANTVKDGCFDAAASHAVDFVVAIDTIDGHFLGPDSNYGAVTFVDIAEMGAAGPDGSGVE
jgi:hypothetical protein